MDVHITGSYLFNFFIKHSEEFLLAFGDVHAGKQRNSINTNRISFIIEKPRVVEGPSYQLPPL